MLKRMALVALFLMFGLTAPVLAADTGGMNGVADLEERVADLESTVVTRGNRKMSLTLSGQVSRSILYWNDGDKSGTYAGLDNQTQSTRFALTGSAKISPTLMAGFEVMTEIGMGARSNEVNQLNGDGAVSGDSGLAVRTANWWLEDKAMGRVTVGRLNLGGPVATIDLGGISTVASASPAQVGGGMFVFGGPLAMSNLLGPTYGGDRIEAVRYDTANLGGFVGSAAWGEDKVWSTSIRYAGEFSGIRIAAGVGYQKQDAETFTGGLDTATAAFRGEAEWSASAAAMHVASGIFAQGQFSRSEFFNGSEATFYLAQGGISKNWFGPGNTSLYGEYGKAEGYVKTFLPAAWTSDVNSDVMFYGVGAIQQLDAAAMEIFLGWRRFDMEVSTPLFGGLKVDDQIDIVHGGARIRF